MQPIASTCSSSASSPHDLHDDVTCTIRVTPPLVLRQNWKTLVQLASRRSKPPDLDAGPTPSLSSHRLCGTTDKPSPTWFWGLNQETITVILRSKSPNCSCRFWGPNRETRSHQFWGQTKKPCAWCRPHTVSPDLSIVRPPSTRLVLDHPRLSAPGLLLLPRFSSLPAMLHLSPTHQETSKHNSPHKIDSRVEPPKSSGFKFKSRQVNYSSQIKPRYWPLGFSLLVQLLLGYVRHHTATWVDYQTCRNSCCYLFFSTASKFFIAENQIFSKQHSFTIDKLLMMIHLSLPI
jgi:hypothetical protein